MTNSKPVALWAVPRSISTAFERVFVERDDFEVLHEPFSAAYYYGEDRVSDRFAGAESKPEYSYERVVEDVFRPREERVFVKDMAYQAKKVLSPEFASRFVNTFIIRDPKYVLMSLVQDVAGLHVGGDRIRGSVQALQVHDRRGGGRGRRRCDDLLGEPCWAYSPPTASTSRCRSHRVRSRGSRGMSGDGTAGRDGTRMPRAARV